VAYQEGRPGSGEPPIARSSEPLLVGEVEVTGER